jgi:hypothetical protein
MVEICWVLIGKRQGDAWQVRRRRPTCQGKFASVEADWAWALEREEQRGDVAGFWHTHPRGAGVVPSERDRRTMQAWCSALGKPLLCLIADGVQLAGYLFSDENCQPVRSIARSAHGRYTLSQ